ncbi:MAG: phosphoribosyl-AMP cyclohydrolase [Micrococcales bacterium]
MKFDIEISSLKFDSSGLIPAIIQDSHSGRVIMFAWMNKVALEQSLKIGETVFYSRSRSELWHKGATSGNTQIIETIEVDCDRDVLLIGVKPKGPACHTGEISCFDTGSLKVNL